MEVDETGTITRQRSHRIELIDPTIEAFKGRIVKTAGDGILVEFASAVDAVDCAVEIQNAMVEREADRSVDQRIQYRIGINVGDIVIDGDDILGDGVNVAARLEGLAEPGGVCVSAKVHGEVRGKVELAFEDLGEQTVKNIVTLVPVYKVRFDGNGTGATEANAGSAEPLTERPST
jgi:adenylate cyclase